MDNSEIIRAAKTIEAEMVTLAPRLHEPYRSNVEVCQKLAHDILEEIANRVAE